MREQSNLVVAVTATAGVVGAVSVAAGLGWWLGGRFAKKSIGRREGTTHPVLNTHDLERRRPPRAVDTLLALHDHTRPRPL